MDTIKKKLKLLGYYVSNKSTNNNEIFGGILESVGDSPIDSVITKSFRIIFTENYFKVVIGTLVPYENRFKNENEVVNFIKKELPLK